MPDIVRPKTVITGHMNADYDALAAMVAAGKLYPDAVLIAPTMLERQGSHLFSDSIAYLFNLRQPRECDFSEVDLLVVVDTHQESRIEHVRDILANPGLVIHVYDHHPDSDNDLPAALKVVKAWGSCTSIITLIIQERGIALTRDEATMMGLGIYEDTGSFTFTSTTGNDFEAAAYLRGYGMDLETIAELLSTDFTREQIHVLDDMLRNAVTHTIQGIPITVTEVVLDDFMGDVASLVHKLIDMENIKIIFVLAAMGDRVHMIARSKAPDVDVGMICGSFGGGGHSFAASASIKQKPLAEIRSELLAFLVSIITPQMSVGRHMTSPAICADEQMSIGQAEELMNRYGLKAIPVLSAEKGRAIGLIEQHTAARAGAHKLGHLPVTEYMQRSVSTLDPEADLYAAMEIILKQRQRLIPVVEQGDVVGVLTRTDVIRLLVDDTLHIPEGTPLSREHRARNVASLLHNQLPEELVGIMEEAGRLGDEIGMPVYAVGGFVRDLILKRSNLDIDLSVEGDGIHFAEELATRLGGKVRPHQKFKTAIVFYRDGKGNEQHLDVATARLEYYEYPAALPTVELSSIKMDLYRRDFTINALAIQLNAEHFGTLIDPFGAQRDMKERSIAVLHSLSFVEDPTRILRAVRFERRFEFRVGAQTERLIKNALSLGMLDKLSGSRLFNELKHVFDEKDVPACIRRMDSWNLLRIIHPQLKLTPNKDILVTSIDEVLAWYRLLYKDPLPRAWMVYLLGLTDNAKYPEVASLLDRLGFIERAKTDFLTLREKSRRASGQMAALRREGGVPMSVLYEILRPVDIEGLLYLMARHGQEHNIGQDISLFLTRLKDVTVDITGDDLRSLGRTPGPEFGEVLSYVLAAKLDGKVSTKESQLALASRYFAEKQEGREMAGLNVSEVLKGRT
ncbi:MAG: CBS domain-containing protein [Desulfovibrio sp.]|jgi:tRNA nucleotidyltransferase (CCA-adding enzyme)|nr:CBS domain-containing protein [Desulfovibrio sp.]